MGIESSGRGEEKGFVLGEGVRRGGCALVSTDFVQ